MVPNEKRPYEKNQKTLNSLDGRERSVALDVFAAALRQMFSPNQREEWTRQDAMDSVGKALECTFDVRQFDNFLTALARMGQVKVFPRTLREIAEELERIHRVKVTVVAGRIPEHFDEISARVFIEQLDSIGSNRRESGAEYVNVGIVSGSTTRQAIEQICRETTEWKRDFGVTPKNWPSVRFFALNTCAATPADISGNANILCYRLAEKTRSFGGRAEAYGLNAQVVLEHDRLTEIDHGPQTKDVLFFTEPCRLDPEVTTESSLDLILTGAGELEKSGGAEHRSLFRQLAEESGLDIQRFIQGKNLIGDLAYTPIDTFGEEVALFRDGQQSTDGTIEQKRIVFYSAARLSVFKSVARDRNKAVILVARSDQTNKSRIVRASRDYISHLVVDEKTAGNLK